MKLYREEQVFNMFLRRSYVLELHKIFMLLCAYMSYLCNLFTFICVLLTVIALLH